MKILKILNLSAIVLFAFTSCDSEFLDRTPPTSISDEDFWKTKSDLELYANNWYNNFLPAVSQDAIVSGPYGNDATEGSDDYVTSGLNATLVGNRVVPESGGGWSTTEWGRVRNVNYFLANYTRCPEPFANIKTSVGEAYFFRAYVYFGLMKNFGDLPWIDELLSPGDEELNSPRVSRSIITDNMLADLDKAIEYLPSKPTAAPGRINREVAMAFQARIALYEGTWEKYHAGTVFGVTGSNGEKFLQKAATVSKAIIDSGLYGLDNTTTGDVRGYWNLFNQTTHNGTKEIMFYREYNAEQGLINRWAAAGSHGEGKGITKTLVDDYLCKDGKPKAVSPLYQGDQTLLKLVTNRDPRLDQTIRVNDTKHPLQISNGITTVEFTAPFMSTNSTNVCISGLQRFKGTAPDAAKIAGGRGDQSYIYFRYAEVLLTYAEAKAELGTLTQGDVDITIKRLRDRVKMPNLVLASIVNDPNWQFPTLSPIINEVRRERHIELALEGYRHDDIWRWAAADELIVGQKPIGAYRAQWSTNATIMKQYSVIDANGYVVIYGNNTTLGAGYGFKLNRDYLSPIPLNQITLVGYPQNPGW